MRILPLSIQLIQKRSLNNNNKVSNPQANSRLQNDTVSFSGSFVEDAYNNLNDTINNRIMPLVEETKPVYQTLVNINKDANKFIMKLSEHEMNFLSKKEQLADLSITPENKHYKPYMSRYYKYRQAFNTFSTLKNIAKGENYNKKDLQDALKNAEILLSENNPELNKIMPLAKAYESTAGNIGAYNEDNTLKNSELPLNDKMFKIYEIRFKSASYAMLIPLPETYMMMRSFKDVEKELQKPSQSPMKTLTTIEHLQQSSESIIQNFDRYKENKAEITAYIDDYNKNKLNNPSDEEFNKTYDCLTKACEKNALKERDRLYNYYENEYLAKGVKVDFKALDKYLNDCEKAVDRLYNKKKQIDKKFIEENNRKFYEKYGVGPSELNDD